MAVNLGVPVETADHGSGGRPCLAVLCVCHTSLPGGSNTVHDTMEALHMELSLALLYTPCPLPGFHLHPSTVINHNCECNGFE